MIYSGNISKMLTKYENTVQYFLHLGENKLLMNSFIGKHVSISFKNRINCISCSAETKKSFHQGYCYSCFISVPQCDPGVLRPEQDMAHKGIARDLEYAKKYSLADHVVYLSITGGVKVGVTRLQQIPYRWIDQGAIKAIKLAKTPYRNLAGQIEVFLKDFISDKTHWSKMLNAKTADINLIDIKQELSSKLPDELKQYVSFDNTITTINYPYNYSIDKFTTTSLDKTDIIEGKLIGIKGQYLIFENGKVMNVRKHNGYFVEIEIVE